MKIVVPLFFYLCILFSLEILAQETNQKVSFEFPSLYRVMFNKILQFLELKMITPDRLSTLPRDLRDVLQLQFLLFQSSLEKIKKCNATNEPDDLTEQDVVKVVAVKSNIELQRKIASTEHFFKNLFWKIKYDGKGSIDKVLIYSSCYQNQDNMITAQALLVLGANPNITMQLNEFDNRFFSPILMATENNNQEIVELLKKHGAIS